MHVAWYNHVYQVAQAQQEALQREQMRAAADKARADAEAALRALRADATASHEARTAMERQSKMADARAQQMAAEVGCLDALSVAVGIACRCWHCMSLHVVVGSSIPAV